MTLSDLLRASAGRLPDKTALHVASSAEEVSYSSLDTEVDRIAAGLQGSGVAPGDRVGICLGNVPDFIYAYLGVLRAGGVVVPLNVMLTAPEMRKILDDATPRVVITSDPFLQAVAKAGAPSVDKIVDVAAWDEFAASGAVPTSVERGDDDLAILAYTSGTTGDPKGAMLTHGNLLANLQQQMDIPEDRVGEDDVLFLTLPMFHIFGLNVPLGLMIMNGATGVLVERFEPVDTLRLIEKYKPTVLFGAPPMYAAWVSTPGGDQYDLSSVRLAVSGAAPLSEAVLKAFDDVFGVKIYEGYGMTETAPTLTTNRMAPLPRPGSIGMPLPGVEMKLLDEEGNEVEIGDTGEIVVRGPNVFKGYWNRDDETARSFRDGWFHTGDIAVKDEEGYLYIVDRKRDLIIVSGFNVFPSEVEAALMENPAVADAAVIGEPHPYTGEAVTAFVVLAEGATATEEELKVEISTRLARFKCPHKIEIVDSLPHLLTGKVLRRALRS